MKNLLLEPIARQTGGYNVSWDESGVETRRYTWDARCAECKHTFGGVTRERAEEMWWDHIRSQHPSTWAIYHQAQVGAS